MKVKCIENNGRKYLTVDKTYEVIAIYNNDYRIIDDDGDKYLYSKELFKSVSEIRNDTINKLLEE